MKSRRSPALAIPLLVMAALLISPMAAADGVPAVPSFRFDDEDPDVVFESIFESRQLAQVEQLNDTHQRIHLFLSVYSLDPGENLSVIVPLRTLPDDITGRPMEEQEFREQFRIAKAERQVVLQDPGEAWGRVGWEAQRACGFAMGSLLWSMPAELVRRTIVASSGGWSEYGWGMMSDSSEGMDHRVQHYEFDGFTIDVLAVTSGPTMSQYLEGHGYAIPESAVFDDYVDHYVAIVESETRPPIDAEAFAAIQEEWPELVPELVALVEEDPELTARELAELKEGLYDRYRFYRSARVRVEDVFQLVDALFGVTDFNGELVTITLPMDEGRLFFPLGTSGGWPNEIGDIDVLFKVPEGKDLRIEGAWDAYFEGHHWYLFSMQNAAPDFDLESRVRPGDEDRRDEAEMSAWVYDHAGGIAMAATIALVVLLWFAVAFLVARRRGHEGSLLRDPKLWLLLGGALLISLPGALLVYMLFDPVPLEELRASFVANDFMALYVVAAALMAVSVALA